MKNRLNRLRKDNNKGFTLVEIIVVLVILAILAAIAVPSVLGYVDDARKTQYISEMRSIYLVIQTEETKYMAENNITTITAEELNNGLFKKLVDKNENATDKDWNGSPAGEGIAASKSGMSNVYYIYRSSGTNNDIQYIIRWKSSNGKIVNGIIHENNKAEIDSVS